MSSDKTQKPNVLLICTDHWSGTLMRQTGHPVVMTPTLDQLSQNGICFTNAYSACPSCIPARRTLMTGMTAKSHGDRVYKEGNSMPDAVTLAQCFRNGGYQAYAVGKLHVTPQRNRIGFDDVILEEQGRHLDCTADDWEMYLSEQGYTGEEYSTGMCHNDFLTRAWHLPEKHHAVNWAVREMCKTIRRRDPTRPGFWYLSFSAPHPPLTPPQAYMDLYRDIELDEAATGNWSADFDDLPYALWARARNSAHLGATEAEKDLARRAFYAEITHLDHQIRVILGFLREEKLDSNTIVVFTSDHGHMIGNHGMWCMAPFYEMSAKIPLIVVPTSKDDRIPRNRKDDLLAEFGDIMPTLLELAGLPIPETVDAISLIGDERREHLYGEYGEGVNAMRMIREGRFKLIYYPCGNRLQLFDLEKDTRETCDLSANLKYSDHLERLKTLMMENFYGDDEGWVKDGLLVGTPEPESRQTRRCSFGNQRGLRFI